MACSALRLKGSHLARHDCGPWHIPDLGHHPLPRAPYSMPCHPMSSLPGGQTDPPGVLFLRHPNYAPAGWPFPSSSPQGTGTQDWRGCRTWGPLGSVDLRTGGSLLCPGRVASTLLFH